jgi:hypothetical protein
LAARQKLGFAIGVILALALIQASSLPASAEQRLQNCGFEQGASGWSGIGISTSGCPARTGSTAAGVVAAVDEGQGRLQQTVGDVGAGSYTLTGYLRLLSGTGNVNVALSWRNPAGQELIATTATPTPSTGSYGAFTLTTPSSPPAATHVVVRILITSTAGATLCVDDLSLDGPPPATSTPTATATFTSTPTQTPTLTPTTSPLPADASPTPTSTSTPAVSPTTPPGSQPPSPPPPSTNPSLSFVNGGFEDGVLGWQKFGGELAAVGQPRRNGNRAGAFTSATTSTKWAFQTVAIDPAATYEFAGHLRTDSGVGAAYLRISWYASGDGSGQALATDDSTSSLGPASGSFVYLTTGPRRPPPTARSARLRVMLAPQGTGQATLHLDDFSFGPATLPANQAPPPSVAAEPDEPAAIAIPAALPAPGGAAATPTFAPEAVVVITPTPLAQVAGSISGQAPENRAQPPAALEDVASSPEVSALVIGAAGVIVFGLAFGGAYLYSHPATLARLVRWKQPNL